MAEIECALAPPGTWSPLGAILPKPCPASGFFCPGGTDEPTLTEPGEERVKLPPVEKNVTDLTTTYTLDEVLLRVRAVCTCTCACVRVMVRWSMCVTLLVSLVP